MLLTCSQAATVLQCHVESVRRWVRNGKLKAYDTPKGQCICLADLGLPEAEVKALEAMALELMKTDLGAGA